MPMWQPGKPVVSGEDAEDHALWRQYRTLKCQRDRRAKTRRIDFHVLPEAAAVIDRLRTAERGGDASSIINRIIAEWAVGRLN
jgi:hypothetical protein